MRCDTFLTSFSESGRSIHICTAGFCFFTFPDRRSHACSVEPPHPTEPPNAVTRSRRKYHSGVARIGYSVFKVPGAYKPLYLSNGQKIRGWPTFSGEKNTFFCPLTYNGNDRSHFARSGEKYIFSSVFPPLPITAKKTAIFRAKVQSFEKYISQFINCPSPITERKNSFFQRFLLKKPLFFSNPSTYNGIDKRHF